MEDIFMVDKAKPGISIIILNRNGAYHLERLLKLFKKNNSYDPIEIIIVDHASVDRTDEIVERWSKQLPISFLKRDLNYSYAESNNYAVQKAKYPYLLFMNNDIIYTNDVLPLAAAQLKDNKIGAVGVRLDDDLQKVQLFENQSVQHVGIKFAWDIKDNFYRPYQMRLKTVGEAKKVPNGIYLAVTGAFLLCRKADFLEVGGFCEEYDYGFEDVDFCLQLNLQLDKACLCINEISLQHVEGASRKKEKSEIKKVRYDNNINVFKNRLGYVIKDLIIDHLIRIDNGAMALLQEDTIELLDGKIAVVCHVYYLDHWKEIAEKLRNIPLKFTLFATIADGNDYVISEEILKEFPEAEIRVFPNKGRDIAPFIQILPEIINRGYEIICKVHTKKTDPKQGGAWRQLMIESALGTTGMVSLILNSFASDPSLGIIGPSLLYKSCEELMYENEENFNRIWQLLYNNISIPKNLGFFAGSCFWVRSESLRDLAALADELIFEDDNSKNDGQVAHAVERLFAAIVMNAGYSYGLINNEPESVSDKIYTRVIPPGNPSIELVEKTLSKHSKTNLKDIFINTIPIKQVRGLLKEKHDRPTVLVCSHTSGKELFGGELSFLDILDGFNSIDYNIITAINNEENTHYVEEVIRRSNIVVTLDYKRWHSIYQENESVVSAFCRIIDKYDVNAVHSNTITMIREPLKAARMMNVPSVVHIRELIMNDPVLAYEIGESPEQIVSKVKKAADFIIANSQTTARAFYKPNHTFVVHNTIDHKVFDIENSIKDNTVNIALVSSNIPKKGIYDFLELARILYAGLPEARFLIIGPDNEHISELKDRQLKGEVPPNIFFMGYMSSPVKAISESNILLNLSHFQESFGRTVLEAMAARRPVIAYDWGALPELINDGYNGFLVPYSDVAAVAEKVKYLCENRNELKVMGERGHEIAVREFSKEGYAKKLKNAYNFILDNYSKEKALVNPLEHYDESYRSNSSGEKEESLGLNNNIDVSVIIPNYNYAHYLPERLDSILKQTFLPAEIIFLDDASTDNSVEVAGKILRDSQIPYRMYVNKSNKGVYHQWIKGIKEANSDYIWIAEVDDLCRHDMLEKLVAQVRDKDLAIVYCQSEKIDENGNTIADYNLIHTNDLDSNRWKNDYSENGVREVVDYLYYRNTIPNVSACLLNRKLLDGIENDLTQYSYCGDWFLHCYLLGKGGISYLSEPLNKFRRHSKSVTHNKKNSIEYLKELVKIKKYIIKEFPIHRSQIGKGLFFLNKDYQIEGVEKNSDHDDVLNYFCAAIDVIKNRRRIVFITTNDNSYTGGSEQLWREASLLCRNKGHDVLVVTKKWEPLPEFLPEFENRGINLVFKGQDEFNKVSNFKPDLVVVSTGDQDEGTEWLDCLITNKIPYVIVNQLTKEPQYWPVRDNIIESVRKWYVEAAQIFFTCNNNIKVMEERLSMKIPNASIHYNPYFVDMSIHIPFPSMEEGLKIAIPARFLKVHKGQHLAIELLNHRKWRKRSLSINLYGEGPDEAELRDLAEHYSLSSIRFNKRTDMLKIWMENHAIMLPSFMEGLPIVLINALICARVPIVTDIGAHSEVIIDDTTGFLAKKPTVESLDEALERAYLKSHYWELIGQKARNHIMGLIPEDPVEDFLQKILLYAD